MRKCCVLRAFLKSMVLKKKVFSKSMILNKNFFVRSTILNKNIFCKKHDFGKIFWSCQFLNQILYNASDFNSNFLQRVRFYINFYTTRQILNNLSKSTTCTFHIAFLHITMYSYNLYNIFFN